MGDRKRIAGMEASLNGGLSKRRKTFGSSESLRSQPSHSELGDRSLFVNFLENSGDIDASDSYCCSFYKSQSLISCCSSNESSEVAKNSSRCIGIQLQVKSFETVDSRDTSRMFSESSTMTSQLCENSYDMKSAETKTLTKNKRRGRVLAKTPSRTEVDDFFAEAERQEQKRFAEKYNFDIVKDVPLEGRYQWVRLKH